MSGRVRLRQTLMLLLIKLLLPVVVFFGVMHTARAENARIMTDVARWRQVEGDSRLSISLENTLSEKQKNILGGGFTTVSQLTLYTAPSGAVLRTRKPEDATPLLSVRCTVKFDAWEETYDIARLGEKPQAMTVRDFKDYGTLCLTIDLPLSEVDDLQLRQKLASGGALIAELAVKQTSAEEADRIKNWLIQQQSGVIEGLFAHMLGELSVNQNVVVSVAVPALTSASAPLVK